MKSVYVMNISPIFVILSLIVNLEYIEYLLEKKIIKILNIMVYFVPT